MTRGELKDNGFEIQAKNNTKLQTVFLTIPNDQPPNGEALLLFEWNKKTGQLRFKFEHGNVKLQMVFREIGEVLHWKSKLA